MIDYSYPLYRPPAEAENVIIQATYGCSYNNCSFCTMYKSKNYKVRDIEDVYEEIDKLSAVYPDTTKVFLADGDALSLEVEYLVSLLEYIKKSFSRLRRISSYASAQNILNKSDDELKLICESGLNLIYYGIETGDDLVLKKITKGVTQTEIIESLNRASESGMKISATVILGIGGENYSKEHIEKSAEVINNTKVNYLSTLQLGLEEGAKEKFYKHFDDFVMCDDSKLLEEQRRFLELIDSKSRIIFRSNHASNALHLAGTLPKDKERLLAEVDLALNIGEDAFVPKMFRGF